MGVPVGEVRVNFNGVGANMERVPVPVLMGVRELVD
jgi:hypothetical protein